MDNKIVTIGIQARSTSKRFPNKVNQMIGDKTILQRLIDSANDSAKYLNRYSFKNFYEVNVAVCCPTGDEIATKYHGLVDIVEGSEDDVLSRYLKLAQICKSDYVVRVTADCPLIPSFVISKMVMTAIHNKYDYISNVEPTCRTSADGYDCEVFSRQLLEVTYRDARDPYDREHVTPYMRKNKKNYRHGIVVNHIDLSGLKFSVDTVEEYNRVLAEFESVKKKLEIAAQIFGSQNVHRL